jgi:hypothetical protein
MKARREKDSKIDQLNKELDDQRNLLAESSGRFFLLRNMYLQFILFSQNIVQMYLYCRYSHSIIFRCDEIK